MLCFGILVSQGFLPDRISSWGLIKEAWPQELPGEERMKQMQQKVRALEAALDSLQRHYARQVQRLQERINRLEEVRQEAEKRARLERLREIARQFTTKQPARKPTRPLTFYGGERQQQALNPEISVTGDFLGRFRSQEEISHVEEGHGHEFPPGNRFHLREAEFHIVAPLDPYTRGKFFLGIPGGGHLHVGEAYMEWSNLPAHLNLKVGKFRNQFGVLNRWHAHGLPQVDRPRVLTHFLGEEGLSGMGIGFNGLLPRLWAHVNEWDLEVVSGGGGVSFAETGSRNWVYVGHLKNYYDLTRNAYLEWGLSGAWGHHDEEARYQTLLLGGDLTYKWVPIGRSRYRTFELRAELLYSHRQEPQGYRDRWGLYGYIHNRLNARWWVGIRFDYSQIPTESNHWEWGGSLVLTFWQSEFVFFRLQYSHWERNFGKDEDILWLQSVWSMGPHKHEAY